MEKIKLGISSCLLGQKVRYDGNHKYDPFLVETLGNYVEYVAVCPEVECGFSTPREALRLTGDPAAPRLVTVGSQQDVTDQMTAWAKDRIAALEMDDLCGFIFKSKSPSSGMERIKVYDEKGVPHKIGVGLFAAAFMAHFPWLPVEDEGRLHDPILRDNFIERIFVMKRWRDLLSTGPASGHLVDFHTRHKLLILAHSPEQYRIMGRLVAQAANFTPADLYARYAETLMRALTLKATPNKHTNVLQHMLGYFKKDLTGDEKLELLDLIRTYQHGDLPLIVPVTMINHYVRKYHQSYLADQIYLNPHPLELQLRNHV